jgi:hypothetical protein
MPLPGALVVLMVSLLLRRTAAGRGEGEEAVGAGEGLPGSGRMGEAGERADSESRSRLLGGGGACGSWGPGRAGP